MTTHDFIAQLLLIVAPVCVLALIHSCARAAR